MSVPLTLQEQLLKTYFRPKKIKVVLFSQTAYDTVWTDGEDGEPKQAMIDIDSSRNDSEDMEEFVKKFGVQDKDIFRLANPKFNDVQKVYLRLMRKLMKGRQKSP